MLSLSSNWTMASESLQGNLATHRSQLTHLHCTARWSDLTILSVIFSRCASGWKCQKCDLTTNLWLNLTDGSILCGRRYFDGSGGNNHAVEHYEQLKYPLAVKLGTITPDGADVHSYDEDEMVEDPQLAKHLAHFGINIASMTKTDATMTELEIDMNMRIGEWSIIQESGKELTPCYGPGYTGLSNLGNSCYLNSVMQVMFTLPEFKQRYYDTAQGVFQNAPANPTNDFECQM